MDELISRQDAIDALGEEPEVWHDDSDYELGLRNQWRRDVAAIKAVDVIQPEQPKWVKEIEEAYERALANPYIRKPLSRALYEVWHRYDMTEVERR